MIKLLVLVVLVAFCCVSAKKAPRSFDFEFSKKPKVLVTHKNIPSRGIEMLKNKCVVVVPESVPPKREEILKLSRGVDGILWGNHEHLDAEALDAAGPNLKAISLYSVGYDYADLNEIKKRKISFGNTPDIPSNAVADIAIGLLIAAGRRFHEGRLKMENDQWVSNPQFLLGQDIEDSTVGIVGFGRIGQAIAKRLQGFELKKILYSGHNPRPEAEKLNAEFVTFNELLAKSDYVVIAAPLTNETLNLFNATTFAKMKPTSVLINVARGQIVNTEDLVTALKTGQIFAAGLDVMEPEPLPKDHDLFKLPNVVLVPHLGSATYETRSEMAVIAAQNVLRGIAGQPMLAPVA